MSLLKIPVLSVRLSKKGLKFWKHKKALVEMGRYDNNKWVLLCIKLCSYLHGEHRLLLWSQSLWKLFKTTSLWNNNTAWDTDKEWRGNTWLVSERDGELQINLANSLYSEPKCHTRWSEESCGRWWARGPNLQPSSVYRYLHKSRKFN